MKQAKTGDVVKIFCTGHTEDGRVFETATAEPMEFTIGNNEVVAGLEKSVIGMAVGEKKKVTVPPREGYGEIQTQLVDKVKKSQFPEHIDPVVGLQLKLTQADGNTIDLRITEIKDGLVTLDANHPLAGRTLNYDIELAEVK